MSGRRTRTPKVTFSSDAYQRIIKARIPLNHKKTRISIKKVKQLVEKIFQGCTEILLYPFGDAEEGFSGALLLRVEGRTSKDYLILPCILKVGSQQKIKQEFRNFRDCVDLVVDNAPHVYRDGYKNIEEWAAIAYTKIGGRWEEVKTFKALYSDATSEEDLEKLRSLLRRLFEEVMSPWLELRRKHGSIWKIYHLEEGRLKEMAKTLTKLKRRGYELGSFNPIQYWKDVLSHEGDSSPAEVGFGTIHGDLNSRNILLNEKEDKPYLIDFSETGQGHYLRDFAKLEADIKFVLMDQHREDQLDLLQRWLYMDLTLDRLSFGPISQHPLEEKITDSQIQRGYKLIQLLRSFATQRISLFPPKEQRVREYRIALLHYTLKKLTFNISDPKLIFACRSAARLCQFQLTGTQRGPLRIISKQKPGDDPKILFFLWLHGTYEWPENLPEEDLRRYFCVSGCVFESDRYDEACRRSLEPEQVVKGGYTEIISVVIDKQVFAIQGPSRRKERLVRLGLGAALEWFGEYLLIENKKGHVVAGWKGEGEQGRVEKVYREIYQNGTELRSPSFFQHLISWKLGIEKSGVSLGVSVAQLLADVTKRDILQERGIDPPENFSSALRKSYWAKLILPSD